MGEGLTNDSRRVALSEPSTIKVEFPSGATSKSFATKFATCADDDAWIKCFGQPRMKVSCVKGGLAHDASVLASQPMRKETQNLIKEVDARTGHRNIGPTVHPRSHEEFLGRLQLRVHSKHRVRVSIAPAADQENRTFDSVILGPQ